MADSLPAAVVLAAGAGERLRPLTRLRPKPLCPVGNEALLDLGVRRAEAAVGAGAVAVNIHHHRRQLEDHLAGHPSVQVSIEADEALGTAGALGHLRPWLDGRAVLVVNADSWSTTDLASFTRDWTGDAVRMLVHGDEPFGPASPVVACLMPWSEIVNMAPVPSGLYEVCWRQALAEGRLETVNTSDPFVDCGTPARYLEANLAALRLAVPVSPGSLVGEGVDEAGGRLVDSVVGAGATVHGEAHSSVVWPGALVHPGEVLDHAVRTAEGVTVYVR